eukprot:5776260-Lingulodinium_polyedra.AAC.1
MDSKSYATAQSFRGSSSLFAEHQRHIPPALAQFSKPRAFAYQTRSPLYHPYGVEEPISQIVPNTGSQTANRVPIALNVLKGERALDQRHQGPQEG